MFEFKPIVKDEPKETVSARIPIISKRALEIEAQQMGVTVTDIITELVEGREIYFGIKDFDGLILEISEQNKVHIQSFCLKNNLNPTEYFKDLVNNHIEEIAKGNVHTHTSFSQNNANATQHTGLQAFANVNAGVNDTVYGRGETQTPKMEFFANREKSLNDAINTLKLEVKFPKLFENAIGLIKYCYDNSGVMKKQLQKSTMYSILLENFSEDEVQILLNK